MIKDNQLNGEGKGPVDGRAQCIAGLICRLLALFTIAFAFSASTQSGYRLGAGDKIKAIVFGKEDVSGEYEVVATGKFRLRWRGSCRSAA